LSSYEQILIPNHFLEGNTTGTEGKDAQKFSVSGSFYFVLLITANPSNLKCVNYYCQFYNDNNPQTDYRLA
jgi:hypothetical protein